MPGEPTAPTPFGRTADGRAATLYTLASERLRVRITDYGGRLVSIEAPDRHGRLDHVLLGFDDVARYVAAGQAFGALLGRNANRIAHGRFTLDGRSYELVRNEDDATLHGGKVGFDKVYWRVEAAEPAMLRLSHVSADGDQGFPGEVSVRAEYRVAADTLSLSFVAATTRPTPLNLSAHPYFNLGGPAAPHVLDHEVALPAESFLPTDKAQLPTGEIVAVAGTPFDFRSARPIGERLREPDPQLLYGRGYDHYFILGGAAREPRLAARLRDPGSGRVLELLTTQRGVQLYTGNKLDGTIVGRGGIYRQSAGVALEPQGFPDAPNRPSFPSTILRPGETYREIIAYRFGIDGEEPRA